MKKRIFNIYKIIFIFTLSAVILIPVHAFSIQKLTETEMGNMTAQTGATFVLENFDFFVTSPGVMYLESSGGEADEGRDYIEFRDIMIHDGLNGSVNLSTNLDWDIFSLPIDDVEYNFARFQMYNTSVAMDIDIDTIQIQATPGVNNSLPAALVNLEGVNGASALSVDNLKINSLNFFIGGASNNIGQAMELDLNLSIDSLTVGLAQYGVNGGSPVVLDDIRIAGSFTGSEPDYDRNVPVAYSDGLWSEDAAAEQADGNAAYEEALLASSRWVPDPGSWVGSGVLKLGDIEHGNPIRMDIVRDDNQYIPFKYNITSGNEEEGGAQYNGPAADQYFCDARGWKNGIDNYSTSRANYTPFENPRYGKTYISQDLPVIGSIRLGSEGGDIVILDGLNLQIHAEIPGYGYGNTPNSIPRPFFEDGDNKTAPVYDVPIW